MKNEKPLVSFSVARILCSAFGHRYKVSNVITDHIKEYKCQQCGEEITNTANGLWERLTPKFKETNEFLAKIHQKRRRKKHRLSKAS